MQSQYSSMQVFYTKSGLPRFVVEVRHPGLNKYQEVRGDNQYLVRQKVLAKMAQWDEMWARREEAERRQFERQRQADAVQGKKDLAVQRTQEAQEALESLLGTLAHTLSVDDRIDWESLKLTSDFPKPRPPKPALPEKPEPFTEPAKPVTFHYRPKFGLLDWFLPGRRVRKMQQANTRFNVALRRWEQDRASAVEAYNAHVKEYNAALAQLAAEYKASLATWESEKERFLQQRQEANAAVDEKKRKYGEANPDAIEDYCDMVLSNSQYPDYFPQSWRLDYNPENRIVIVEYDLPAVTSLPSLKEVRYIQSKDEFTEKHVTDAELRRIYDALLYQIALRTIHELYESDAVNAIESIVFNGYVSSIDQATGQAIRPCVLSVQANREEFLAINLAAVDPKACFKKLKGVGSSQLHSMTPVPPVLRLDREDERFIEGRSVVDGIAEGDNLAAMDWQDFEHLIRELFEKEFGQGGGEVKVTRASRDGGVDAVAFDPDPIRGGKIVIQAKRYTNTVGVSAVRDLYGTVVNEGANKGILVCTSDYGPDAYAFARGKPLVLLSGGELLHLLERHGHKARIDLSEAKKLLADNDGAV